MSKDKYPSKFSPSKSWGNILRYSPVLDGINSFSWNQPTVDQVLFECGLSINLEIRIEYRSRCRLSVVSKYSDYQHKQEYIYLSVISNFFSPPDNFVLFFFCFVASKYS